METYRDAAPPVEKAAEAERWLDTDERDPPTSVLEMMASPIGTMRLALGRRKLMGLGWPLKIVGVLLLAAMVARYFADDREWLGPVAMVLGGLSILLFIAVCFVIAFWHRDREFVEIDGARVVVRRKKKNRIETAALADVEEALVVLESHVVHLRGPSVRLVIAEALGHDVTALDWIAKMINRNLTRARETPAARL